MITPSDGLIVVVKRDCPTCVMVEPVLAELVRAGKPMSVITQDDPSFPAGVPGVAYDQSLERSVALDIEAVPTLIRFEAGRETARCIGWNRAEWEAASGAKGLGPGLPAMRPGCGSKNVEPGIADELAIRFGRVTFKASKVELGDDEDDCEACFDRDWTDGLPVVPPTPVRVKRMLEGTRRDPAEVLGLMPPDYQPATVEKIAINAVMAGCRPEYMPLLLAATEAALADSFALHGVIATTQFVGPIIIVNGPVRKALAMNTGINALGQGNRANSTVGRALQLAIRNIGGGKPGGVDRATLGTPGKVGFCFPEDEEGSPWEPLSVERGIAAGRSAVTLYAGYGVTGAVDQLSRTPEGLTASFAAMLRANYHPKTYPAPDAFVVVSPEHRRIYAEAGWSKAKLKAELHRLTTVPAEEIMTGVGGMATGVAREMAGRMVAKFAPDGLNIVAAGGQAGLFSAILTGWSPGKAGSHVTTRELRE